jgi:hypothetical protein
MGLGLTVPASAMTDGPVPSPLEGFALPNFSPNTSYGKTLTLSGWPGKGVVVNL